MVAEMGVHQVLIGALNPGENSFSIGNVEGLNFIGCAVGADVVILAPNFERIQVIIGNTYKKEELVTCVNCCPDSGKIAVCYGNLIRILEPMLQNGKTGNIFFYNWIEVECIELTNAADNVQWALDGLRLLVLSGQQMTLYEHKMLSNSVSNKNQTNTSISVKFSLCDEDALWNVVWNTTLATKVKYVKFSPDGTLFATCGEEDCFIKIWYQIKDSYTFPFIYIQHPAPVSGFEWRLSGRFMPRKYVQNALITWCADNTSRIWKEIPNRESSSAVLTEAADIVAQEKQKRKRFSHKNFHMKKTKTKLVTKLSNLMHDKKLSHTASSFNVNTSNMIRSCTVADFAVPVSANSVVFSLAATINADNDCFLVPSMNPLHSRHPFTVHWLNNKELIFTSGAEQLLAEALMNDPGGDLSRGISPSAAPFVSSTSSTDLGEHHPADDILNTAGAVSTPVLFQQDHISHSGSDAVFSKDILDVKLEGLLRRWSKSCDVLFSVHPVDGSLLTWTLEWLDDSWHQATASFASRFPDAFPLVDAASLNCTLCTFNSHDAAYIEIMRRQLLNTNNFADKSNVSELLSLRKKFVDKSQLNKILLVTNHENGSLNLWRLTMDDVHNFSNVLNIVHESRMCGNRFQVSQIVAHPSLPLLLTGSHFQSSSNNKESELILWKVASVGPLRKSGGLRELARISNKTTKTFKNLAWIPTTLPSYVLGTVCNSPSSCFVASCNGKLCVYQAIVDARGLLTKMHSYVKKASRSSSSSSVADAISPVVNNDAQNLGKTFDIISTQSTSKPGCVLSVADVADSAHNPDEIIFLHVFDELLAADSKDGSQVFDPPTAENNSAEVLLKDKYLVVVIARTTEEDRLQMWLLSINARRANFIADSKKNDKDGLLYKDENSSDIFYPTAHPARHSASKLSIQSEKVYDKKLDIGAGVRVQSCVAAAGHLSSSSLYPACRAPYTLFVSCTDDHVRFLRCVWSVSSADPTKKFYDWESWKMVNDEVDSCLEMDGEIYSISSAYSGRFACVFHFPSASSSDELLKKRQLPSYLKSLKSLSFVCNMELAVFECESSGGVEWLREDVFNLGKFLNIFANDYCLPVEQAANDDTPLEDKPPSSEALQSMIRINWASAEDGSHILTVGIGYLILLFAQVSQNVAQHNIVMMKDNETMRAKRPLLRKASSFVGTPLSSNRLIRWVCIRSLQLHSADGLPPLPTAVSWVREGLLVVGMNSEMRVYNQWGLTTKIKEIIDPNSEKSKESIGSATHANNVKFDVSVPPSARPKTLFNEKKASVAMSISRSHSMLDQLNRKAVDQATSSRVIKEIMSHVTSTSQIHQKLKDEGVLDAVSEEGLFEAARLANPMLPQYHPKQLIEMLNAGKTKRVKAILLHVLKTLRYRQVSVPNPLARASSVRKMTLTGSINNDFSFDGGGGNNGASSSMKKRRLSVATLTPMVDETNPDYDELDTISPLPLYLLFSADDASTGFKNTNNMDKPKSEDYDVLFNDVESDEDLDEVLIGIQNDDNVSRRSVRTRHSSGGSEHFQASTVTSTNFTVRHSRLLTELLTHTHLPGLSSVDQMHLLAVADTISHFSSNIIDKLAHANAALRPAVASSLGDSIASGYASAATTIETVDECGLRFLMAMKQHEYLLLCLPLKQRKLLRARGISTAHIIWAFHSDTEMELLNSIPCCQKGQENWEELRAFGVAWWLKNTATLRACIEKVAKSAFQQNQDPMDASLFYLAMKKKNVLTHLFKTVDNKLLYDFFREDFTQLKWKNAALKNAYSLMSKQRFHHSAAFFLLGGSLTDALQTIITRLKDLQLAMCVLRLYETDVERQSELMTELLCHEVLGCEPHDIQQMKQNAGQTDTIPFSRASRDPFERSMAFWLIKEYAQAASTLVEEASKDNFLQSDVVIEHSLSDIFNFYSYLRRHPLVVRQRLTNAGIQMASTDQFLACAKKLENHITPSERRLYFRTASAHMASGCPLLALDVLSRFPRQISSATLQPIDSAVPAVEDSLFDSYIPPRSPSLKLFDDEDDNAEEGKADQVKSPSPSASSVPPSTAVDFISQHLKFIAVLRIMMDELATLASGFEIDGGQLRFELFKWLENECEILHRICDFRPDDMQLLIGTAEDNESLLLDDDEELTTLNGGESGVSVEGGNNDNSGHLAVTKGSAVIESLPPLYESLRLDRLEVAQRLRNMARRCRWLRGHQKLLRTLTAYCSLHSAQNYRLTSIQMELLLLLFEVQRETEDSRHFASGIIPDIHSFPLLVSSLSSCRMFVTSPLHFLQNQCADILLTIAEIHEPLTLNYSLDKVYMLYNLCQGLSSCVYQSLSDIDHFDCATASSGSGVLTYRTRTHTQPVEKIKIQSAPSKWPGVERLTALLMREKDDDVPNLRLLLVEFFVAITMSLFCYAFTIYDSRWLYRLCAHNLDADMFGQLFGGGGEKKLRSVVPCRPAPPNLAAYDESNVSGGGTAVNGDSASIRAKLHAKVFGDRIVSRNVMVPSSKTFQQQSKALQYQTASEQSISCWVPPSKNLVQFYAEKVDIGDDTSLGKAIGTYDSDEDEADDEESGGSVYGYGTDSALEGRSTVDFGGIDATAADDELLIVDSRPHDYPNSYAWTLLRLACVVHIQERLRNFISLAGFDFSDIAAISPNVDNVFKVLAEWSARLEDQLDSYPHGCPPNLLHNTYIDSSTVAGIGAVTAATPNQQLTLLRKYNVLVEPDNTPFEYSGRGVGAVRRLWNYMIRQEHLCVYFVKHIFGNTKRDDVSTSNSSNNEAVAVTPTGGSTRHHTTKKSSPEQSTIKIIQREHEPIIAFTCCVAQSGCVVVSTGREMQEISLKKVLDNDDESAANGTHQNYNYNGGVSGGGFLSSRVDLDIAMQSLQRDILTDNDDYQLILPDCAGGGAGATNKAQGKPNSSALCITSFIVDRSRVALKKFRKRPFSGIRRLESHTIMPYYVSGGSDGSILLWEWGIEQPLCTARHAGQYAKVSQLAFAQNSNKFAAVDGDGMLCIWKASQQTASIKPFFSQKSHTKSASDVRFMGQTSSLLITAGHSTGDQNVVLWDTLLPQSKAMVHSFVGHPDGATCALYLSSSQSIVSSGRHGELCVWDVRQCQLRTTIKAFDSGAVRCAAVDANCDVLVAGSSEGDIRVWSAVEQTPRLLHTMGCEHAARGGFSLRQVASSSPMQGVQQVHVDNHLRLFSCGADNSLKCRQLPPVVAQPF